jgi:hypothetical protein
MGLGRLGSRFRGSTVVSQWLRGGSGGIARIQRASITIAGGGATSNTATIIAVDVSRTRIVWLGTEDNGAGGNADTVCCRVELTDPTTVTASCNSASAQVRIVSFEVIEYHPGVIRRIQRGTLATSAATAGTATLTGVDTARTTLDGLGFTTTGAGTGPGTFGGTWVLTNATTVTFTSIGSFDRTVGYQAVEWSS